MAAEKPIPKGQAWFCTTGLPSDVVIEVADMSFHLHKFPLMSKSKKLHDLITEQETNPTTTRVQKSDENDEQIEEEEEEDETYRHISLPDFPGGSEAFEAAAKFCYGVKTELSSANVAPLRCAGEVLEMTEEYAEDNLISRTEKFLSHTVLKSINDSIKALNSCERLTPMSEELGIVERCIESIADKASSTDPSLFGWPVNENPPTQAKTGGRRKSNGTVSWLDELAIVSLPMFKRLIDAMRARDLSPGIIENCLIHYGNRHIPGISRSNRKPPPSSSSTVPSSTVPIPSEDEQRELLETITANLPIDNRSRPSTTKTTRFLFGLLRTTNILKVPGSCRDVLEKKIGSELEQATLDDLLIPSYSYLNETLYDVDCVERIFNYFLENRRVEDDGDEGNSGVRSNLMLVGKLIDGYLAEIASDTNLKPEKFCDLAVSVPAHARHFDDGLYRAVDVYLKAHQSISEADRDRICGLIDCQKLTLEACTHAAQNERLPLRAVIQVLFFEQLQLRQAIAGTLIAVEVATPSDQARRSNHRGGGENGDEDTATATTTVVAVEAQGGGDAPWRDSVRKNQMLRLDMDSMRSRVHELERECSSMKKAIENIDNVGVAEGGGGGGGGGWRSSVTKKFGCKFRTQVCDSHESAVVAARKGRNRNHPKEQ